jgi:hypothetical protein
MTAAIKYVDHEVRVKMLEQMAVKIDNRFDRLEAKIDSNFLWMIGLIISMFGGVILHMAKLI